MENEFDFVSIGAGCAGLAAVQYAARSALKALAVDTMGSGGQVLEIAQLENYPGMFPPESGFQVIDRMKKQAQSFGATILTAQVRSVKKDGAVFVLDTSKGEFRARAVVIATGAEHRRLGVKGEKELEGRGVSFCATCDGPLFRNKRIFVIGGGDAACDEAFHLASLTENVSIVHRRDEFRAQKAIAERTVNHKNITPIFNSVLKEIKGENKVQSVVLENLETKEVSEHECDAVFVSVGILPRNDLFPELETDAQGYIVTDEKMRTKIAGLYAAGDIRSKPLRQVVTAVNDGAIAAFDAADYIKTEFA